MHQSVALGVLSPTPSSDLCVSAQTPPYLLLLFAHPQHRELSLLLQHWLACSTLGSAMASSAQTAELLFLQPTRGLCRKGSVVRWCRKCGRMFSAGSRIFILFYILECFVKIPVGGCNINLLLNLFEPRKLFSSEHVMTPPRTQLGRSNLFLRSTPCSNSWSNPHGYYPIIQINRDFSCLFHVQGFRLVPTAADSSVQILFCGKTRGRGLNSSTRFTSETGRVLWWKEPSQSEHNHLLLHSS